MDYANDKGWLSNKLCTSVREMAEEIRKLRVAKINETDVQHVIYDTIGKRWVRRYLNRHPELAGLTAKAIEAARVKEVTQKGMMTWFNDLANAIEEFKITPENMYNMDKSGKKRSRKSTDTTNNESTIAAEPQYVIADKLDPGMLVYYSA